MEYENILMNNKDKLEKWLDKNIFTYGGDLFNVLMEKELISYDDIENVYSKLNKDDFESEEEYNIALNEQEPQQVMQWFIVSEEGYNKFKSLDYPVVKFKELYFYGRTSYGQAIITDFYYLPDGVKVVLDI